MRAEGPVAISVRQRPWRRWLRPTYVRTFDGGHVTARPAPRLPDLLPLLITVLITSPLHRLRAAGGPRLGQRLPILSDFLLGSLVRPRPQSRNCAPPPRLSHQCTRQQRPCPRAPPKRAQPMASQTLRAVRHARAPGRQEPSPQGPSCTCRCVAYESLWLRALRHERSTLPAPASASANPSAGSSAARVLPSALLGRKTIPTGRPAASRTLALPAPTDAKLGFLALEPAHASENISAACGRSDNYPRMQREQWIACVRNHVASPAKALCPLKGDARQLLG